MGEAILIVDDNAANLKLAKVALATEGYDIQAAGNAEEAMVLIQKNKPRLILMDLQLPGMDGLTLTDLLKHNPRTQDIVIVAMTAYAMKGDEERIKAAGCDGYIPKPIDTLAFPAQIAGYLKK